MFDISPNAITGAATSLRLKCCESVSGIVRFGVDLTSQLPVRQHLCVKDWARPVGLCLVEDGLVEYMVIAEVSI